MARDPLRLLLVLVLFVVGVACKPQIGDACKTSVDCSQTGDRLCDITQPGGYCTVFNCEPGSCPSDSACIAFDTEVSSLPLCRSYNGLSRLTRSYCLANCGSNSDCRSGYVCENLDTPYQPNAWNALLIDRSGSGKVCVVPASASASVSAGGAGPSDEICGLPEGVAGGGNLVTEGGGTTGQGGTPSAGAGGADGGAGG